MNKGPRNDLQKTIANRSNRTAYGSVGECVFHFLLACMMGVTTIPFMSHLRHWWWFVLWGAVVVLGPVLLGAWDCRGERLKALRRYFWLALTLGACYALGSCFAMWALELWLPLDS